MNDEYLTSQICMALMRIGTRMTTGFDQRFAEYGITQAQFRILHEIHEQGGGDGVTPSALADHLLIERGTVSVLTNRMVRQGWLERRPGENRRTYRLALTGTGEQALYQTIPRAVSLADQTLVGISRSQLEEMRANLELIETRLRQHDQIKIRKILT